MDPDAALEEVRRIVARADAEGTDIVEDYNRLIDLIDGLDQWISRGGFMPKVWGTQGEGE